VLAHESYHEGVIGLAAGKLVEEYYRPAIVLSKGVEISKASARSISGFNIIESIRKVEYLLEGAGGHPMAAGFSIKTINIEKFRIEFEKTAKALLPPDVLKKKLKIDTEIDFNSINDELVSDISKFEPFGIGNPAPTFISQDISVVDVRTVGSEGKHLKLKLSRENCQFDAIFFGGGEEYSKLKQGSYIDAVFAIEENIWNDSRSIQLKVKDIKTAKN
jgi:single-stranded-DNA-specific exonuclease